jgi:integrase/recombinase XerD
VSGKTGSRYIPLFHSVPYIKDWLDVHPYGKNPNAPLIPSLDVRHKRYGLKMKIPSLFNLYAKYRDEIFPDLLNNPVVPPEDKIKIKNLIHNRKWNPYVRRHTALTEKAKILKEPILKSHSGWSQSSQMHLKYEHWFGNESTNALLEAYGVLTPEDNNPYIDTFKPKACPNCRESNIPDAKFCKSCRMVLTYDAFQDTLEEQKKKDDRLASIEKQVNALTELYNKMSELKQEKTPEQELKHADMMLDYKKIEDIMVKNGMLQEKDRSENASKGKTVEQILQENATFRKEKLPAILKMLGLEEDTHEK